MNTFHVAGDQRQSHLGEAEACPAETEATLMSHFCSFSQQWKWWLLPDLLSGC